MKKTGIPIKGAKLTKAGKIEKAASPNKASVSQKIAARKSKKVRVVRGALSFEARKTSGTTVIDWSAKGGSGCRPATSAEIECLARIAELEDARAAEIATRDEWQCGYGAELGTGNCADCQRHRASLAALGRKLPPVDPCHNTD